MARLWRVAPRLALCGLLLLSQTQAQAQTVDDQKNLANLAGGDAAPEAKPGPGGLPADAFKIPAKKLFGRQKLPSPGPARAYGTYAKGCQAGAVQLPRTGPAWQVMRPSRNRAWANPALIKLVERLATEAKAAGEWNGLLVGDMSQPRGGPMISGHASHQIGLDADVWLTPMPDRELSDKERENISATVMTKNRKEIDTKVWSESRMQLIRRAAMYPEVARIFVHPPIKAELCKWAGNSPDNKWLAKVRPLYGHNYHFHIRIKCPAGVAGCKDQWTPHPKDGTGCGEELAYWMSDVPWTPKKPDPNAPPYKPPPPLTLAGLPAECRAVIAAP